MRTLPVVLFLLFPFSALRAREPAEKVALVQTLEELAQRPPIRLSTGWEVRLGLSDGGKAAGHPLTGWVTAGRFLVLEKGLKRVGQAIHRLSREPEPRLDRQTTHLRPSSAAPISQRSVVFALSVPSQHDG